MHEQGLAGFQSRTNNDVVPDREKCLGKAGRNFHFNRRGYAQGALCFGLGLCRIAATVNQRADPLTRGEAAALARYADRSRHLEPHDRARIFRWRIKPHALQHVRSIDTGISHIDDNFVGSTA